MAFKASVLLCTIFIVVFINNVNACRPRSCRASFCKEYWEAWSPFPRAGTCVKQKQKNVRQYSFKNYVYTKCFIPNVYCTGSHRYRTFCSCKYVYHCSWLGWNSWSGIVPQGTCRLRSRYRMNKEQAKFVNRVNSCASVPSSCDLGKNQAQQQTLCSCKKLVSCTLNVWTNWSPTNIQNNECVTQTRKQIYIPGYTYVHKLNNCEGISTKCRGPIVAKRKRCKCKYVICTRNDWTAWRTISNGENCPKKGRFQHYTARERYREANNNCDNVHSQACPKSEKVTKDREVKCPQINVDPNTKYFGKSCDGENSFCDGLCNIECHRPGYTINGKKAVICLATGKWDGQLGRCRDTERPELSCPNPTQGNDPNKDYATMLIPSVTATDNSKQTPTISVSHRSPVKVKVGQKLQVTYTATDGSGNKRACISRFEAKDIEPPKVTFCPKDLVIEVESFPHTVVWKNPIFYDNVDKQHVQAVPDRTNGQKFYRGRYTVNYIANDKAGNTVNCTFDVQVEPIRCMIHLPPKHGALSCNRNKSGVAQVYLCSPSCKTGYWFLNSTQNKKAYPFYLCGDDGTWRGLEEFDPMKDNLGFIKNIFPKKQVPWPNCAAGSPPAGVAKTFRIMAGNCKDKNVREAFKQKLLKKIKEDVMVNAFFCQSDKRNCVLKNLKFTCASSRKRGIVADRELVTLTLVLVKQSSASDKGQSSQDLKEIKQLMPRIVALIKKTISSAVNVAPNSVQSTAETFACGKGRAFSLVDAKGTEEDRSKCVLCPAGTYQNSATGICSNCQIGTYQDEDGFSSCKKCPSGFSTHGSYSTNFTECKEICKAGTYSTTGLGTCIACAKGTYQPYSNSTSCIKCPRGKGTTDAGSIDVSDCVYENLITVQIKSEGFSDPGVKIPGTASIKVNGTEYSRKGRGYNIVVVNEKSGVVENTKAFDTHASSDESVKLANFIKAIKPGKIVLVAIQDEATFRQEKSLLAALKTLGGKEPLQREFRASFALAGVKGTKIPSWVKQVTKSRSYGPSEVTVDILLS